MRVQSGVADKRIITPRFLKRRSISSTGNKLVVEDFEAESWILDIGGGGEGVLGRLKGEQVVAIEPSQRELEGAPRGPLKIVRMVSN